MMIQHQSLLQARVKQVWALSQALLHNYRTITLPRSYAGCSLLMTT